MTHAQRAAQLLRLAALPSNRRPAPRSLLGAFANHAAGLVRRVQREARRTGRPAQELYNELHERYSVIAEYRRPVAIALNVELKP